MEHPINKFSESFDGYCVIHAPFATAERRTWFEKELPRIGLDQYVVIEARPTRYDDSRLPYYQESAINGHSMLSLADAYKRCIDYAIGQGWKTICVLEDDAIFRSELDAIWMEVRDEVKQPNWDFLYLYRWQPIPILDRPRKTRLIEITENLCLHAFVVRDTAFMAVKGAVDFAIQQGVSLDTGPFITYLIQHDCRVVATSRNLVGQAGGFKSALFGRVRTHSMVDVYRMRSWCNGYWHLRWIRSLVKKRILRRMKKLHDK